MLARPNHALCIAGGRGSAPAIRQVLEQLCHPPSCPVFIQAGDDARALADAVAPEWRSSGTFRWAAEAEQVDAGQMRLCPPGRTFAFLSDGTAELVPAVGNLADTLFERAAAVWAEGLIAALFSASPGDGVDGFTAVQAHGGVRIVLSPIESASPQSVIRVIDTAQPSAILLLTQMAPVILSLLQRAGAAIRHP